MTCAGTMTRSVGQELVDQFAVGDVDERDTFVHGLADPLLGEFAVAVDDEQRKRISGACSHCHVESEGGIIAPPRGIVRARLDDDTRPRPHQVERQTRHG